MIHISSLTDKHEHISYYRDDDDDERTRTTFQIFPCKCFRDLLVPHQHLVITMQIGLKLKQVRLNETRRLLNYSPNQQSNKQQHYLFLNI